MGWFKKEEIDYDKLAIALLKNKEEFDTSILEEKIKNLDLESSTFTSFDYTSQYDRYPQRVTHNLKAHLLEKIAPRLADDLYELRKLEILQKIGSKEIIEKLDKKLEEKIQDNINKILRD